MNPDEAHQQELEQEELQQWMREWHCIFCGKLMNPGCPHPTQFECCGEIGHVERLNENNQWEYPN